MKKRNIYFLIFIALLILMLDSSTYTSFSSIYKETIRLLSMSITFFIMLVYIIRNKYSNFVKLFILYVIFGIISCQLGQYSSINSYISAYSDILGMILLLDIAINYDSKRTIKCLEVILFILITINTITILLHPLGLYASELYTTNWFLLYDNMHIFIFLPALLISLLSSKYNNKKYNLLTILLLIMITGSVYYCFSANTVVAYTLFLIYLFFTNSINKVKLMNSYNYFVVYITLFVSIVLFRIQEIFSKFIVVYLQKDLTFSGRTILWDRITKYISKKPVLGYGIENNKIFTQKMGSPYFTHGHNTIYDILYKGGVVSLVIFMSILIMTIRKLYKYKDNVITKLIAFTLFCALIMMNFEARQEKIGLWIILIIAYNVNAIIKDMKVTTNESN